MNAVIEPLVLTRLTIDMRDVLSCSLDTAEMFNSIASGTAAAITRYTETIFLGSIYDRTTPCDIGTDCDEDVAEGWKTQSPSGLRATLKDICDRASRRRTYPSFQGNVPVDEELLGELQGQGWYEGHDEDQNGDRDDNEAGAVGPHFQITCAEPFTEPNPSADEEATLQQGSMSESIQELCIVVRDALRRFSALKSFK